MKSFTIEDLGKVLSGGQKDKLFGASLTVDFDGVHHSMRLAPLVQKVGFRGESLFNFTVTVLNKEQFDIDGLISLGQDATINVFGDTSESLEDPEVERQLTTCDLQVLFGSPKLGSESQITVSEKQYRINKRQFHLYTIHEVFGKSQMTAQFIFGDKEKLGLLQAVGLRMPLTKSVTKKLLELLNDHLIPNSIEGALYYQGKQSSPLTVSSYYPENSQVEVAISDKDEIMVSQDTGVMDFDTDYFTKVTGSMIDPVEANGQTRYKWDIFFRDKSKLTLLLF